MYRYQCLCISLIIQSNHGIFVLPSKVSKIIKKVLTCQGSSSLSHNPHVSTPPTVWKRQLTPSSVQCMNGWIDTSHTTQIKLQVSLIFLVKSIQEFWVLFFLFPWVSLVTTLDTQWKRYSICTCYFSTCTVDICFKVQVFLSHSMPHPWNRVSMTNILYCSFDFCFL